MEYVAGQPLTAWCDGHQVGVRERLRLFLQVLDAVHYAHARQVLHPGHQAVEHPGDRFGARLRLLDFGVASCWSRRRNTPSSPRSTAGALTPNMPVRSCCGASGWMRRATSMRWGWCCTSSWQAASVPAEDGGFAHRAGAGGDAGAGAAAQHPGAAGIRPRRGQRLSRSFRGACAGTWMRSALKALERLPHDRYPSAEALADDVQHYLSGKPVEARPAHPVYLLTKFVLRHRAGVAMSAAATLAVLVAVLLGQSRAPAPAPAAGTTSTPAAFSPPAHSIAVLPLFNMSGDPKQEYFSDGLSEELLQFSGNHPRLAVGSAYVLGSSLRGEDRFGGGCPQAQRRRSTGRQRAQGTAITARIAAQLINAP